MENGLHAFRVALHTPRVDASQDVVEKEYHTRKAHKKSRAGCEGCKQRRKRCDERRPQCSFCVKRDIACNYPETRPPRRMAASDRARLTIVATNRPTTLWPGAHAPMVLTMSSELEHTEHDLYLLHHFTQVTAATFGPSEHSSVFANEALGLAKEYPFVMHAMIALGACHLQHMGIDAGCYRMAESLHCQYASQGLRNAVSSINGVNDSDSILTSAMLLNTLTFCFADDRDEIGSGIGRPQEPRWGWLRIQIGLTGLLTKTSPFHRDSIWMVMFIATHVFEFTEPPLNNLDEELAAFCEVDENSTEDNNVYYNLVERMAPIVVREPSSEYLIMYLNAVGGISSQIVDLLEAKDTKALLLFAHWLALMCSIDQWWCVRRTRRECWMVCDVLSKQLQPESIALLERPARACGFPLNMENELRITEL